MPFLTLVRDDSHEFFTVGRGETPVQSMRAAFAYECRGGDTDPWHEFLRPDEKLETLEDLRGLLTQRSPTSTISIAVIEELGDLRKVFSEGNNYFYVCEDGDSASSEPPSNTNDGRVYLKCVRTTTARDGSVSDYSYVCKSGDTFADAACNLLSSMQRWLYSEPMRHILGTPVFCPKVCNKMITNIHQLQNFMRQCYNTCGRNTEVLVDFETFAL